MNKNFSDEINELIDKAKFKKLIKLIKRRNREYHSDHYLLGHLAGAYYELKKYGKALKYIRKALLIKSDCPFLWWHLAAILEANGENKKAITIWKHIISYKEKIINYKKEPCWESDENKNGLIVDSYYRIGNSYFLLNKKKKAIKYFKKFIKYKKKCKNCSITSIYNIKQADIKIKQLSK